MKKQTYLARIQDRYESGQLMDFFGVPQLMTNKFFEFLVSSGVKNLEGYDAIIQSRDEKIKITGYKAFNIIGLASRADLYKDEFSEGLSIEGTQSKLPFGDLDQYLSFYLNGRVT